MPAAWPLEWELTQAGALRTRPYHLPISSSIAAAARSPLFFTSSAERGPSSSQTMYARRCSLRPVFSGKICAAADAR